MDVGPTRSMGPTLGRFEPTKPTAPDALTPAQDASRLKADGAASKAEDDAAKPRDRVEPVQHLDELQPGAINKENAAGVTKPASPEPSGDVPEGMGQFMEKLAGPFRALLEGDRLSPGAKKALAQALTQLEFDTDSLSSDARSDAELVDAKKRYEKMETAIDEFYATLKRIFRIGDDAASGAPSDEHADSGVKRGERQSIGSPTHGVDGAERAEEATSEREKLLRRVRAAYGQAPTGERKAEEDMETRPPSDVDMQDDKMYARFASMYTALYPTSSDRASSLNTEG